MSAPSIKQHLARKRFGQNFLQDRAVIEQIVRDLHLTQDDFVVEIGPGVGALTMPLLAAHKRLDVIEIDRDLIAYWQQYALETAPKYGQTLVVHGADVLKFNFADFVESQVPGQKIRLVGNLPYNISSPILFMLQDLIHLVEDQHFMLQKEVVDRMIAQPGSSDFSRLSVMLQATYTMTCLQTVPPDAFEPAPKVWSAIVRMVPLKTPVVASEVWSSFAAIVAQAFSQRRKMLRGVLKPYVPHMEALGIDVTLRAEDVSVQQFASLAKLIYVNSKRLTH